MPDPTTSDFVVSTYVRDNYSGTYQTRQEGGYTYREYDNARGTFWFDNNQDGWFEYGRRDEGNGEWSTFVGFYWDDIPPPPPRFPTETPIETDQGGFLMEQELSVETGEFFSQDSGPHRDDISSSQATLMNVDDGWFL